MHSLKFSRYINNRPNRALMKISGRSPDPEVSRITEKEEILLLKSKGPA